MKCDKCGKDFEEKFLDAHHIHPKFMDNKRGNGKKFMLCDFKDRGCHYDIHHKIIIPLLNNYARTLKFNGSEYWLWKKILLIDRPKVILEIIKASEDFINKGVDTNGNSRST